MIDIRGFIETSMLDWDGKISSVIFLAGCNFRCPFCDNGILILAPETLNSISFEEIKKYLLDHKEWIDGVVISGGEPTINSSLPNLANRIKDLGFLVKVDTNGSNPKILKDLINKKLIDYVAMDLKAPLDGRYNIVSGARVKLDSIKESIDILMYSEIDYEFRTTIVPTLLDEKDIEEMAKSIKDSKKFILQQFVPDHAMDDKFKILEPYPKDRILEMIEIGKNYVKECFARGI